MLRIQRRAELHAVVSGVGGTARDAVGQADDARVEHCGVEQLERRANHKLAVLRHVEEVSGSVAATCRYYGISRQASLATHD